jgi:hypothetical protein
VLGSCRLFVIRLQSRLGGQVRPNHRASADLNTAINCFVVLMLLTIRTPGAWLGRRSRHDMTCQPPVAEQAAIPKRRGSAFRLGMMPFFQGQMPTLTKKTALQPSVNGLWNSAAWGLAACGESRGTRKARHEEADCPLSSCSRGKGGLSPVVDIVRTTKARNPTVSGTGSAEGQAAGPRGKRFRQGARDGHDRGAPEEHRGVRGVCEIWLGGGDQGGCHKGAADAESISSWPRMHSERSACSRREHA